MGVTMSDDLVVGSIVFNEAPTTLEEAGNRKLEADPALWVFAKHAASWKDRAETAEARCVELEQALKSALTEHDHRKAMQMTRAEGGGEVSIDNDGYAIIPPLREPERMPKGVQCGECSARLFTGHHSGRTMRHFRFAATNH